MSKLGPTLEDVYAELGRTLVLWGWLEGEMIDAGINWRHTSPALVISPPKRGLRSVSHYRIAAQLGAWFAIMGGVVAVCAYVIDWADRNLRFSYSVQSSRYAFSIAFEVDGRTEVARSVVRTQIDLSYGPGPIDPIRHWLIEGEAVALDLPLLGQIFVLPSVIFTDRFQGLLLAEACGLHRQDFPGPERIERWMDAVSAFRGECPVTAEIFPPVIMFTEPENYNSAQALSMEDIAEMTAGRARFLWAEIETTDEAPTHRLIEQLVPLFNQIDGPLPAVVDPWSGSRIHIRPEWFTAQTGWE